MHSPIFLDRASLGILNRLDLKFSKKVYICDHVDINNGSLSTLNLDNSYLIVDQSRDPISQELFKQLHFTKMGISENKIIVISPSPDQFFYRNERRLFKHIFFNGLFATVKKGFDPSFIKKKKVDKLFLSLSREDKLPRRFLNYSLHKNKLFNKGLVSHLRIDGDFDLNTDLKTFSSRADFDVDLYIKYGQEKHSLDNLETYQLKDDVCYNYALYSHLNKRVLIDLAVESFVTDYLFVTEKLLKPIVFKTPFLLLGAPYTLKYMKHLGFQTFDCVFDESYDEQPVLYDRVNSMLSNLNQLSSLSLQDVIKNFKITEEICEHNYNVFMRSDWTFNLQEKIERIINVS